MAAAIQYRSAQMTNPWPTDPPSPAQRAAYADAVARPFWVDTLPQRDTHPPLSETTEADLCIVGGGFTGLWAALYAKERRPGARRRRARGRDAAATARAGATAAS